MILPQILDLQGGLGSFNPLPREIWFDMLSTQLEVKDSKHSERFKSHIYVGNTLSISTMVIYQLLQELFFNKFTICKEFV